MVSQSMQDSRCCTAPNLPAGIPWGGIVLLQPLEVVLRLMLVLQNLPKTAAVASAAAVLLQVVLFFF